MTEEEFDNIQEELAKHAKTCQWHDILYIGDCPFCNPVLSEYIGNGNFDD